MGVTPGNLELRPCTVTFAGSDLGATLGNVTVKFSAAKAVKMADQYGKQPLDRVITDMIVTVETEVAETHNLTTIQKIFPHASITTSGGTSAVKFTNQVGASDSSITGAMTLHPIGEATTNFDYNFFCAAPSEDTTYVFSPTEQSKMKIVWNIYPDFSTSPARIFTIGNNSL